MPSIAVLIVAVVLLRSTARGTGAGRRAVIRSRRDHAAAMRAPRQQHLPIAVARLGTGALAGTAYAAYHDWRQPPGWSEIGGSSSSDSGDSGGGSGCGGCGGGD